MSQENVEIVRRGYERLAELGSPDLAFLDSEVEWRAPASSPIFAEPHYGHGRLRMPAPRKGRDQAMNPGIKLLGYARVSTDDQATTGYGLDAQETAIRDACAQRGWVLTELLRDEGESGKSLDRPALREALEAIAANKASGLVVAKLDRLSRSVADFAALLEWFTEAEATLVALDLGIDTSTPGGRLVANVFASVAEWEREVIAARTREGLLAARASGKAISRPALVDDPKLHRRIKRMRERGMTLQAIADRLNKEGVPTLRGGASGVPRAFRRRQAAGDVDLGGGWWSCQRLVDAPDESPRSRLGQGVDQVGGAPKQRPPRCDEGVVPHPRYCGENENSGRIQNSGGSAALRPLRLRGQVAHRRAQGS